MIVAGTLTYKMAKRTKLLYDQMPDPKYVISMGSCANCGGLFQLAYSVCKGVDKIIPVDVYVPGCPPRPENLLSALQHIQDLISSNELPSKAREKHEAEWEISRLFEDKLARVRALRVGRVVKSGGRRLDVPEVYAPDGTLLTGTSPLGIPNARVKGGSVDYASERFDRHVGTES